MTTDQRGSVSTILSGLFSPAATSLLAVSLPNGRWLATRLHRPPPLYSPEAAGQLLPRGLASFFLFAFGCAPCRFGRVARLAEPD